MAAFRKPTVGRADRPWEASARYPGQSAWRAALAMLLSICGGLAVLYLIVYSVGGVPLTDSGPIFLVAIVLAVVWLIGFIYRYRTGAARVTRADRERRGF